MDNIITKSGKDLKTEILEGLMQPKKKLPSKLFYDEKGSALFEQITRLGEYYLTRTEFEIMTKNIDEIAGFIKEGSAIIEFGSGSSKKTRLLFDYANDIALYVPVDISESMLMETVIELSADYPELPVYPVVADYTNNFRLPRIVMNNENRVIYFPGSTVGNFTIKHLIHFFERVAKLCGEMGSLLIGIDLKKDKEIITNAYNDQEGVTAKFNLNILEHLNKEFATDFKLENFRHKAIYNEEKSRIEMYLVCIKDHSINFDGVTISCKKDEEILTEYSYKYTIEEFGRLGSKYFNIRKTWTDGKEYFGVLLLEPKTMK